MADAPPINPTTAELQQKDPRQFDADSLVFEGPRGDKTRHLGREELVARLSALAPAPRDVGSVDLLLARPAEGARSLPQDVTLTIDGGMSGDRWGAQDKYGPSHQLATTRTDFARTVANGQPLELHGDNLFVSLDLSTENLPAGSRVQLGEATVVVTPQAHNGCKKWVQRVGLAAMKLNMEPQWQQQHLRGIYFRVVTEGRVRTGDVARVLSRGAPTPS